MATRELDALNPDALAASRRQRGRFLSLPSRTWKALALYVGVPVVFCLYASLNNWKLLEEVGFLVTLGFYGAHTAIPWTVTAFLTAGVWKLLRPWRPGLAVITLLGSLGGCLLTIAYANWVTDFMETRYAIQTVVGGLPLGDQGSEWSRVLGSMARTYVIWLGVNYVFDRYLGLPRYRYDMPDAGGQVPVWVQLDPGAMPSAAAATSPDEMDAGGLPPTPPAFMARLSRPATLDSLLAIHAEQHYIKVITAAGQELVLYRLSDAVRQLPDDLGCQVHRSWWVSRRAIRQVSSHGKKMSVRLSNGLEVPVSAPYQALVRRSWTAADG